MTDSVTDLAKTQSCFQSSLIDHRGASPTVREGSALYAAKPRALPNGRANAPLEFVSELGGDCRLAKEVFGERHEKNPPGCGSDVSVSVVISSCGDEVRFDAGKR